MESRGGTDPWISSINYLVLCLRDRRPVALQSKFAQQKRISSHICSLKSRVGSWKVTGIAVQSTVGVVPGGADPRG